MPAVQRTGQGAGEGHSRPVPGFPWSGAGGWPGWRGMSEWESDQAGPSRPWGEFGADLCAGKDLERVKQSEKAYFTSSLSTLAAVEKGSERKTERTEKSRVGH